MAPRLMDPIHAHPPTMTAKDQGTHDLLQELHDLRERGRLLAADGRLAAQADMAVFGAREDEVRTLFAARGVAVPDPTVRTQPLWTPGSLAAGTLGVESSRKPSLSDGVSGPVVPAPSLSDGVSGPGWPSGPALEAAGGSAPWPGGPAGGETAARPGGTRRR